MKMGRREGIAEGKSSSEYTQTQCSTRKTGARGKTWRHMGWDQGSVCAGWHRSSGGRCVASLGFLGKGPAQSF